MNSTALTPTLPGMDTVISYPTHSRDEEAFGDDENVEKLIETFQWTTGRSQAEKRESLTPWFFELWTKAIKAKAERAWHLFPEEVFDRIEESDETLESPDAEFLGYVAVKPETPTMAAVAAIRLLGILTEEQYLETSAVLPKLRDALAHSDVQRRYYAAKAIWQTGAREGVDALRRRMKRETSERVRAVIERAIHVLE